MPMSIVASDTRAAVRGALWMLLLMAAFTVFWLTLNAVFTDFQLVSRTVTRPVIQALILYGLWVGLSRAGFDMRRRVGIWLAIAIPFTLWLVLIWTSALAGAFQLRPGGV